MSSLSFLRECSPYDALDVCMASGRRKGPKKRYKLRRSLPPFAYHPSKSAAPPPPCRHHHRTNRNRGRSRHDNAFRRGVGIESVASCGTRRRESSKSTYGTTGHGPDGHPDRRSGCCDDDAVHSRVMPEACKCRGRRKGEEARISPRLVAPRESDNEALTSIVYDCVRNPLVRSRL